MRDRRQHTDLMTDVPKIAQKFKTRSATFRKHGVYMSVKDLAAA